ncbi:MAG: nucleotide sugar dehydrogenase [Actinomycetota bacterium]
MTTTPGWHDTLLQKIRSQDASIAVLGCGYVGLTLAVEFARAGFTVRGVEPDEHRAKELRVGTNPVPDVYIPDGELASLRDAGKLTFSQTLDESCDAYLICVPTPLKDGSPDLRFIESAAEFAAAHLRHSQLVVLESTTYPGTTEELLRPILEEPTGLVAGVDYALAYSPERINPGDRQWGLRNTTKVVGGLTPTSTELACALYGYVCDKLHPVSSPRAAEITKLFENTYREVNIALANEMAVVCHDFEIDPWEVLGAAASKEFGFTPFRPGPGVGGHCLAPDERLFVRRDGAVRVMPIEELWNETAAEGGSCWREGLTDVATPDRVEVAAITGRIGDWNDVSFVGRRRYLGDMIKIATPDGRTLIVTTDHRMMTWFDGRIGTTLAADLEVGDRIPVWRGHEYWDALLNPRIDVIDALRATEDRAIGVRVIDGDWRPWRREIRSLIGVSATEDVLRYGRLPLAAFLELESSGAIRISHEDLVLWTGRGNAARSFPAVFELTPDVARLIGYYAAEGCVTVSGKTPRAVFAFHRDETELKDDLRKILGSLGLSFSVYEDRNWRTTQIKVGNRLFAWLLRDVLGCGANSYDARIPPQLLGASASHRREILRGTTLDGRRSAFSLQLSSEVEFLMLSTGHVPTIGRNGSLTAVMETECSEFARDGELHLVPIKSIERIPYDGYVYSLETEPSHTFATSHGLVVRNCIHVDPQYLAWRVRGSFGRQFRLLETASDINERMPLHVAQRASEILNEHGKAVRDADVLLLGVAYKGGSGDTRESPALRVANRLVTLGASVTYHDPFVPQASINGFVYDSQPLTDGSITSADLVIVLADHPGIDYADVVSKAKCVYDTRGVTAGWSAPAGVLYRA